MQFTASKSNRRAGRTRFVLLALAGLVTMAVAATACASDDPATSTPVETSPTATVTALPTSTVTTQPTPTPQPSPMPTPTEVSSTIRLDSLVCERFFPGVPNPDGPNEWFNIRGSLANPGGPVITLAGPSMPFEVDMLDSEGEVLLTFRPELRDLDVPAGERIDFEALPVYKARPAARSCVIRTAADGPLDGYSLEGDLTVEVTTLAAP